MHAPTMLSALFLVAGSFTAGVSAARHTRLVCCQNIDGRWTYNADLTMDTCSGDYSNDAQFRNGFCTGSNDNKLSGGDFFASCKSTAAKGWSDAAGKFHMVLDGNLIGSGDRIDC